ncbi:MAG: CBS domain-containing protein [Actinobacteria bacterium]|nr:CBS domain-containing protein [Actinomycetota bacterium]
MGFEVYDYAGGLEDWANAGEELAGEHGGGRPLLTGLVRDVPTLSLDATVADARSAMGDAAFLLVVDDDRVVLGKVLARSLEQDGIEDDAGVGTLLIEGPTTVRPTEHLPGLLERMQQARTASVVVTSNQGGLIGVLFTEDAARAVADTEHASSHHGGHRRA